MNSKSGSSARERHPEEDYQERICATNARFSVRSERLRERQRCRTQDRVYDVNQEESDEDKVDRMEQEADV